MHSMFATLLDWMSDPSLKTSGVIPWASPIPTFGDISGAELATVGLNPSNREFVNAAGNELQGVDRRFHTLSSLRLPDWSEANARHIKLMSESCLLYFSRNPYDTWFRRLDDVVSRTSFSLYGSGACHLDLIPYATSEKWTELSARQRTTLLAATAGALGILLADSGIRVLVLNGKTVVRNFEEMTGSKLREKEMSTWSLPRKDGQHVSGFSYRGVIERLAEIWLAEPILVLGYNHNIQSSYGVTGNVVNSISHWVADEVLKHRFA